MTSQAAGLITVAVMVATIITAAVLFWRNNFRVRLIGNIAIVLAFGVFYALALREHLGTICG